MGVSRSYARATAEDYRGMSLSLDDFFFSIVNTDRFGPLLNTVSRVDLKNPNDVKEKKEALKRYSVCSTCSFFLVFIILRKNLYRL